MRRGRPNDDYPEREFRNLVLAALTDRGFSLRILEGLSGVNRGTISAILHGKRPCERQDRAAILRALRIAPETQAQFLPFVSSHASDHQLILLDGRLSDHPQLRLGQSFMSRAQFAEAHVEFQRVFNGAAASGDTLLQADAAGWLGWFHGELEGFNDARNWTRVSIRLIETLLGMDTDEIINSIGPSRSLSAGAAHAVRVLARTWRIYSKVLAVRVVHHMEFAWLPEAKQAFDRSLRLDEGLQLPELGHSLRWKAVTLSAEDGSQLKDVEGLLAASRELFPRGSSGEASLVREQGVVRWQKNRLAKAGEFLWDAKDRLASFADARALGPTFCVLSRTILQDGGHPLLAARYAVVAAGLHPYGYVLDHCVEQLRRMPAPERQRSLDELLAGEKPFDIVHRVMNRVAQGSPRTGGQLVARNFSRVRGALLMDAAFDRHTTVLTKPADPAR